MTAENDKLMIILEDYQDWAIYKHEYTNQHIRKDINEEMGLVDVFKAFSQSKANLDDKKKTRSNQNPHVR